MVILAGPSQSVQSPRHGKTFKFLLCITDTNCHLSPALSTPLSGRVSVSLHLLRNSSFSGDFFP